MKKTIKILTLCLLIIFICESVLQKFTFYHLRGGTVLVQTKRRLINDKNNYGLVILGDSSASFNLRTDLLSEITGKRVANLGLFGDLSIAGSYFIFDEYLKKKKPPQDVIVLFSYFGWGETLSEEKQQDALARNFPYFQVLYDLIATNRISDKETTWNEKLNFYARYTARILLYSYRNRFEMNSLIMNVLKLNFRYLKEDAQKKYRWSRQIYNNFGSQPKEDYLLLDKNKEVTVDHMLENYGSRFVVSSYCDSYFERILDSASHHNVRVWFAFNPVIKEGTGNTGRNNRMLKQIIKYLSIKEKKFNNLKIITPTPLVMDISQYGDTVNHLTYEGSLVFTRWIGKKLEAQTREDKI